MKKHSTLFRSHVWVSPLQAFGLVILFSLVTAWAMIAIAPGRFSDFLRLSSEHGYLTLLLNYLPVLLIMLSLFFITASFSFTLSASSFFFFAFAIVNRMKILFRGDPLLHWDFSLLREALGVVQGFGTMFVLLGVFSIVAYVAFAIWFLRAVRTKKMPTLLRILMTAACCLAIVGCNQTYYMNEDIYKALPVYGNLYNTLDVHTSKGHLYSFIINLNLHSTIKQADYDPRWVQRQTADLGSINPEAAGSKRPHIIAIMGESFSALSESAMLDFSGYNDPLEHFKERSKEGVTGHVLMPWKGGGTGDAEFDFLTGYPSRWFRNVPYAYRMVMKPIEALPSLLKRLDYETFALHPGYGWFYNRQNVYPSLGFSKTVFEDSFPEEAYRGAFITEKATIDKLLEMMDEHLADYPDVPMFGFCVTIENHLAYEDRFLPKGMENFATPLSFSSAERNALGNYLEGVHQADVELDRLVKRLESLADPAILVYFGDHLPALNDDLINNLLPGYDAPEGTFLRETRMLDVPFLLWQNTAASNAQILDMEKVMALLPENGVISSNYLGAFLLEALGFDAASPFFRYVNQLRRNHPAILGDFYFDGSGKRVEDSGIGEGDLRLYREWACYRLLDE